MRLAFLATALYGAAIVVLGGCGRGLPGATAALSPAAPAGAEAPVADGFERRLRSSGGGYLLCPAPSGLTASCTGVISATPTSTAGPTGGYGPTDLRAAYGITAAQAGGGAGQTVAVVVAYNSPTLASDLAAYRAYYGLPPCTKANGCLQIIVENNKTTPPSNAAWGNEMTLDVEMVSALCPNCKIMVAEALTANLSDLATTVNNAVSAGATVVSNSYMVTESSAAVAYEKNWSHAGVPMIASAGDAGYGVSFPASSRYVTAVGGTTLSKNATTGAFTSTAWNGSGSGCSAFIPKPTYQKDAGCKYRTVNDLGIVADPATGVAVYNAGAWGVYGGTSVGSPLVAAMYALAGNGKALAIAGAGYMYAHGSWADVTSGADGTCATTYLCTAATGYDGPTGLGSPLGLAAF